MRDDNSVSKLISDLARQRAEEAVRARQDDNPTISVPGQKADDATIKQIVAKTPNPEPPP